MTHSAHVDTFARDRLPPLDQWPDLRFDLPQLHYPPRLNCAVELLDRHADGPLGDRPAIVTPQRSLTYKELSAEVNRFAHVLRDDLRLVPGNRVLLRGYNNATTAALWLAVIKSGLIAVTTMPLLRAKELTEAATIAHVDAAICDRRLDAEMLAATERCPWLERMVFSHDASPGSLEELAASKPARFDAIETASDDICIIAFTSGTTGKPKGTMHFHRDVLAICDTFPPSSYAPTPDDVFCGTPPLAFTFGLGQLLLFPLRVGASTVLLESSTPETLLQAVAQHGVTVLGVAPTTYRAMTPLAGRFGPLALRACVSAGEALPVATRSAWREATGLEIIDGIGSTEMLHIFISAAGKDVRPGATGKAVPGFTACILDDEGRQLPPGTVGRLAVKGPTGCRYLDDPRQADYVQHGWNVTGDAYLMDEEGYFWYQARTDDMIIASGYNIAGPEVEGALLEHPAVAECAVVGLPDEERGHVVSAFVVLKEEARDTSDLVAELQDFVKSRIAPYKYPRRVTFVDALPRTETGKLQRFKLRAEPVNAR